MKLIIFFFAFFTFSSTSYAQSQKAWNKQFERLDIPADIKEHKLVILTDFNKKFVKQIEGIMEDYKGKWEVQRYKEMHFSEGEFVASLLANGPGYYFISFKAAGDKSGGKFTKMTSANFKNVLRSFVNFLNSL